MSARCSILLAFLIWMACGVSYAGDLSSAQKAEYEKEALAGSPSAAREVALFHGMKNDKLFEYWSWIGAENGDPICQYNYASILRGKSDVYSQMRALYWMKKAAAKKVKFAEEDLREMTRSSP